MDAEGFTSGLQEWVVLASVVEPYEVASRELLAELFPRLVEVLDWYHADQHVSAVARTLYGDGTPKTGEWWHAQLDRLWLEGWSR